MCARTFACVSMLVTCVTRVMVGLVVEVVVLAGDTKSLFSDELKSKLGVVALWLVHKNL